MAIPFLITGSLKILHYADTLGFFNASAESFDRALAVSEDSDTLLAFGRHLLYTDRASEAIGVLQRVRKVSPHSLHARITLARALVQSGRGADAVAEAHAASVDHPGLLVTTAISLAMRALVAPEDELSTAVVRLTQGNDTPPFVWTVAAYVFARVGRREEALDIIDTALICSATTVGEAALYAAPLAALGDHGRAAQLLADAVNEPCGMMAMVLRDPAHADWLPQHPVGAALFKKVFRSGP